MKVEVSDNFLNKNTFELQTTTLDKPARRSRAFQTAKWYWLIAFCAIPIPLVHFFVVPIFFILGFIVTIKKYSREQIIRSAKVPCPNCKHDFLIENIDASWPLRQ